MEGGRLLSEISSSPLLSPFAWPWSAGAQLTRAGGAQSSDCQSLVVLLPWDEQHIGAGEKGESCLVMDTCLHYRHLHGQEPAHGGSPVRAGCLLVFGGDCGCSPPQTLLRATAFAVARAAQASLFLSVEEAMQCLQLISRLN